MTSLTRADLYLVLDVATAASSCESMVDVRDRLLPAAASILRADLVLYIQTNVMAPLEAVVAWPELPVDLSALGSYWNVMQQHPLRKLAAQGMPGSVRLSEVASRRQWHNHPVYRESHLHWGIEDQMVTVLGLGGRCLHVLSVSRSGPSFTGREQHLLDEVRPHVRAAVRRALASVRPYPVVQIRRSPARTTAIGLAVPEPLQVLTTQEAVITGLLSTGLTSAQIGQRLGVSPRTVEKHLEHAHTKLGATNRVTLLARFQELLQGAM